MSDRYSRINALEKDLYISGSPLIISAAVLLRDSYSKKMLAQMKFKNLDSRNISAVKISIAMLNVAGEEIGERVEYAYLDLDIPRDKEFGQKNAVVLPSEEVRSFRIWVTEVMFADSERWQSGECEWTPLMPCRNLAEAFGDVELAAQFQIRYGKDCLYEPSEDKGLWYCTCGALNYVSEHNCHSCRRVFTALKDVSLSSLKKECSERLKAEEEQSVIDAEESAEKKKKYRRLACIIIPIALVLILVLAFVPGAVKQSRGYAQAGELLEAGEFESAREAYTALGDYKDSAVLAEMEVPYQLAMELKRCAEAGDTAGFKLAGLNRSDYPDAAAVSPALYQAAAEHFQALGGYKDSAQLAELCLSMIVKLNDAETQDAYAQAKALLDEGSYLAARDAYVALEGSVRTSDSAKLSLYTKAIKLFDFMKENDIRGVYASISTETDVPSRFSLSKETALKRGEGFITALKAANGKDKVDILLEDSPSEGLIPYEDALIKLFESFRGYAESSKYVDEIAELCDYSKDFFELVNAGKVHEAREWLTAYEDEFENRERWMELLTLYEPYCDYWELYSGDATLIPLSVGVDSSCSSFVSTVIISEDKVLMRITGNGDKEHTVELVAEPGETGFIMTTENNYLAAITVSGRMAYMKYAPGGKLLSSCEYSRGA